MSILFCKRYFQWKYISAALIIMLLLALQSYKDAVHTLQVQLDQAQNYANLQNLNNIGNPKVVKPHLLANGKKNKQQKAETTTTTTTSSTTSEPALPEDDKYLRTNVLPIDKESDEDTTTTTTTTTTKLATKKHEALGAVRKIAQKPYDSTRGTPTDPDLQNKRTFVRNMMKFAWAGYREKAWGFNEVKPDTGRPSTNNIFGAAKTGATIIDALDTLWIMGLKEEFDEGSKWVREEFDLRVANQMLSCFETVIRFLGGLLGAYHMSGDEMFVAKAVDVAMALDPAFHDSPLPSAHFNPKSGKTDSANGRILAEIGSFHLEYYDLAFASGDQKWYDRAAGIREVIRTVKTRDGLLSNRISRPKKGSDGKWSAAPQSQTISFGAEGDSYYEYLIKAFYQSNRKDTDAKEMYDKSITGAKHLLVKRSAAEHTYLSDYPASGASMQHLACFAGGMIAYGAKDSLDQKGDLKLGADITETCHLSYHNSATHIGGERFSTFSKNIKLASPAYYILRPEVVESFFYLWRITKEQKYRDYAWEAAQALEEHCKSNFGYSGLRNADQRTPQKDDLQRSFFLAETLKYLYLIFSEDDLISLDEFVFNTEAHPLIITK